MITSRNNPLVKDAAKLKQKKFRQQEGRFLIEGPLLLKEALVAQAGLNEIFYTTNFAQKYADLLHQSTRSGAALWEVTPEVLALLADTDTPQGAVAVAGIPGFGLGSIAGSTGLLLVLDELKDPGNLGALIRTADAFGAAGVVGLNGTADFFNPKTVRSTMGSLFHLPLITAETEEFLAVCQRNRITVAIAHVSALEPLNEVTLPLNLAVVIGNESHGPSRELLKEADLKLRIPIVRAQSLNAASAGAIILYEYRRQHALSLTGGL